MHNFSKPVTTISDALDSVKDGLHSPKKEFFDSNRNDFEKLYADYDGLAATDELHKLKCHWPVLPGMSRAEKDEVREKRAMAYGLYSNDRPFVNAHWESLKNKNGGETLYCPICGLGECEEMDHYVPRGKKEYPEYAAHLSNLIPLCHICNHKKSSKFLDASGNRIFFNAFYDALTTRELLVCDIQVSPVDGLPQISTDLALTLNSATKPDAYIISTIESLDLMKRFRRKARQIFRDEMTRLSKRKGQGWNTIKTEMQSMATPVNGNPDVVTPAILGAIAGSSVMEDWFKSL